MKFQNSKAQRLLAERSNDEIAVGGGRWTRSCPEALQDAPVTPVTSACGSVTAGSRSGHHWQLALIEAANKRFLKFSW